MSRPRYSPISFKWVLIAITCPLAISSCGIGGPLGDAIDEYTSCFPLHPQAGKLKIKHMMELDDIPERYKILRATVKSERADLVLTDVETNLSIHVKKATLSDKNMSASALLTELCKKGLPLHEHHGDSPIEGGLRDPQEGSLAVGGMEMSYVTGRVRKPNIPVETMIPAFYGCVIGEGNYIVIWAYELDGWMSEAERESARRKRLDLDEKKVSTDKEETEKDADKHVDKDFDLEPLQGFLKCIRSFNLDD